MLFITRAVKVFSNPDDSSLFEVTFLTESVSKVEVVDFLAISVGVEFLVVHCSDSHVVVSLLVESIVLAAGVTEPTVVKFCWNFVLVLTKPTFEGKIAVSEERKTTSLGYE